FGSYLDAISGNEFRILDADEAEHPAQVSFEMFADRGRRAGPIEAATRDRDDDALVAGQTFDALRRVFERLARDQDAVDPGLELAWDGEIVHGRAEHDDVCGQKLFQHGLTGGDILAQRRVRGRPLAGGEV